MDNWNDKYTLTTKEVVQMLNTAYGDVFETKVDSRKVNYWVQNDEILAIKNDKNRWIFSETDVSDFVFRYKHNFLHRMNNYFDSTRIKVATDVLYEIFQECEPIFQKIVCILTTLHPYALYNDPTRQYGDLWRHEGGIVFKGAAVHFTLHSVSPKGSLKQRLFYPIIVTKVIEDIITKYHQTSGDTITARLINVGLELTNNKLTNEEYMEELESPIYFGGWRGLLHHYDAIPGKEMHYSKGPKRK